MTIPQYSESWQDKAAWAQAKRAASLAKVKPNLAGVPEPDHLPQYSRDLAKDVLTSREIELTEKYTITELLRVLRNKIVSVEEVTRAFLRRAALAHAAVSAHSSFWSYQRVSAESYRPIASLNCFGIRPLSEQDFSILCPSLAEHCLDFRFRPRSTWAWSVIM